MLLATIWLLNEIGNYLNSNKLDSLKKTESSQNLIVKELTIYPIKSCAAVSVEKAQICENGLEFDREWLIVELVDRVFKMVTARTDPSLVLVQPEIEKLQNASIILKISASGFDSISIPRTFASVPINLSVWDDIVFGCDQGEMAAEWFSLYLKRPVRLVVKCPSIPRIIEGKHCPHLDYFSYQPQTGFADGFPFLILSEESVNQFLKQFTPSEKLKRSHRNFRCNILIGGGVPFQEDNWLKIKIGSLDSNKTVFVLNNRCARCTLTNVDPSTGLVSWPSSTTSTLKEIMKTRRIDPGNKFEGCIGMNATHLEIGKVITVGDDISILESGTHDLRGIWKGKVEPTLYF